MKKSRKQPLRLSQGKELGDAICDAVDGNPNEEDLDNLKKTRDPQETTDTFSRLDQELLRLENEIGSLNESRRCLKRMKASVEIRHRNKCISYEKMISKLNIGLQENKKRLSALKKKRTKVSLEKINVRKVFQYISDTMKAANFANKNARKIT